MARPLFVSTLSIVRKCHCHYRAPWAGQPSDSLNGVFSSVQTALKQSISAASAHANGLIVMLGLVTDETTRKIAPGVCLTFDDLNVANWVAAQPVFRAAGARATFCVSGLHMATPDQIVGLHSLQAEGHEIGFHSRTHPKLAPYLACHGLDYWLEHEIDRGVAEHRAAGFPATSFAAPFHATTAETRAATAKRFEVTRARAPLRGAAELEARIYTRLGPDRAVDNIGFADMQHRGFQGWKWQETILDSIASVGDIGIFTGHDLRQKKSGPGYYSTHRQLRLLLQAVSQRGLQFYTLTGLARVLGGEAD